MHWKEWGQNKALSGLAGNVHVSCATHMCMAHMQKPSEWVLWLHHVVCALFVHTNNTAAHSIDILVVGVVCEKGGMLHSFCYQTSGHTSNWHELG